MRIEAAVGAKENLAAHAERGAGGDNLSDLLELVTEVVVGERGLQGRKTFQGVGEDNAVLHRVAGDGVRGLHQREAVVEGEQLLGSKKARLRCSRAVESLQAGRLPR